MPTRKTVEKTVSEPAAAIADVVKNVKKRSSGGASKSKTSAATHKRATKKSPVEETVVPANVQATAAPVVQHDAIAKLAYSYWESRGRQGGNAVEDWLRAERELVAR